LEFGGKNDFGCLLECAYNVLYKYYARADWSRANEKVGTPALTIIADTNNADELDDLEIKASNFGNDGFFVGQKGDEVTLLERKNDKFHETFKDTIAYCDEQNSKIINGQTGTTDEKAFVGAANVHERVMEDYTIARLQNVVDECRDNVLPYLIKKGFPFTEDDEWNYPYLIRLMESKINGPQPVVSPTTEVPPAPDPAPAK
jgi:phage gp29-like protein